MGLRLVPREAAKELSGNTASRAKQLKMRLKQSLVVATWSWMVYGVRLDDPLQ